MNSATIAFRVKPEIKKRADALFARLGMTTSTAMNILLMQTLEHRGFAAPITLMRENEEVPNAEVGATLDRILAGTEPLNGPFKNVDDMFDNILKD